MASIRLTKPQMAIYLLIRDHGMTDTDELFQSISFGTPVTDHQALKADIERIKTAVENTQRLKQKRKLQ